MDASAPDLDISTYNLDFSTYNLDGSSTNLDIPTSSLDISTSNLDISTSNLDTLSYKLDTITSNLDSIKSSLGTLTSNLGTLTSNLDTLKSNLNVSTSFLDISTSKLNISTSKLNISTSILDTSNLNSDISTPDLDLSVEYLDYEDDFNTADFVLYLSHVITYSCLIIIIFSIIYYFCELRKVIRCRCCMVLESRAASNVENGNYDAESLPSYTVVSGLPSYEEALEQLKKVKEQTKSENKPSSSTPSGHSLGLQRLSVTELFAQIYKPPAYEINVKS